MSRQIRLDTSEMTQSRRIDTNAKADAQKSHGVTLLTHEVARLDTLIGRVRACAISIARSSRDERHNGNEEVALDLMTNAVRLASDVEHMYTLLGRDVPEVLEEVLQISRETNDTQGRIIDIDDEDDDDRIDDDRIDDDRIDDEDDDEDEAPKSKSDVGDEDDVVEDDPTDEM